MSDAEDEFAGLPEDEEILDDEAGEGSGDEGEGSVDSSEEEEDGENEYEADGFLVDEEEAEGEGEGEGDGEGSDEEVRKVKKKRKKRNFALDEEDYELLEDNQVRVKRPAERKRLKRRGDDEGRGREKASGAKQLQEALFGTGDLEDELEEDAPRPSGRNRSEEGESPRRNRDDYFNDDLSDEMDDFIVDREGGDRRRARRRRDARMAEAAGLSTAAVQAANRLFGNFGELLDLHQSHRMYGEGALDDEMEEEQPSEEEGAELEEDEAERKRLERQERAAARKQQKLLAQVDPELVESHFLRPADQTIRQQDIPERLQLLGKSVLEDVPDEQKRQILDDAARWVADHLFGQHSQSSKVRDIVEDGILEVTGECAERASGVEQGQWPRWMLQDVEDDLDLRNNRALLVRRGKRYRDYEHLSKDQRAIEERRIHERFKTNQEEHAKLQQNVRTVLEHVFEKNEEIPLQAMYRKEGCGELLSLRETDMPETTGNEEKAPSEPDVRWPKGTIQPKHRRIRRWDVLWAVYNWGVRFMELYKRRHRREQQINRAMDLATTDDEKDGLSRCLELLVSKVHTVQGLDDVDAKFRHIIDITNAMADLSIENGEGGAGKPKRPGRPNAFRRYIKLGLNVPAHEVSLSMEEFKENIDKKEAFMSPEDPDISPAEWAAQKIQDLGFDNEEEAPRVGLLSRPQNFLDAIKEVLASELAAEPCLRNLVRNELYQQAVLETNPTPAGEDILDPFHPYGITKHLVEKKVQTLEGHDTWLRIQAAEKQGLITCTLSWPEQNLKELLRDVEELFVSDNTADVAHDWNEWRRGVLATAVKTKLLPQMLNELKARLTTNAIDTVLGQVQDKFWHFVSQPPVRIMEVPDEQDQEPVQMEAPRFMAVVWGSGQAGDGPTTIVQLDGQGNLKDLLTAAQLSGNVPRTVNSGSREMPVFDPAADPKKSRDSHKIREKILEHKPNAILVATTAPQSKQIKDDMEKISQYTESDARFKDDLLPHLENKRVEVMWADDRVASLWANSDAAKAEFPDYSFLVRKAVGVGRMALDPLAIIAVLLGRRKEVLSLRMHELQDRLPSEQLVTRLEQMLISAVAQVGVDINAICANPWRQAPLQFVPGLGPRKARQLLASIAANDNHIKTRMDLYKQDDNVFGASAPSDVAQMGRIVFRNSAPFIRVRRGEVAALQNEEEFDALDDIRINPEEEAILQIILDEAFPDVGEQGAVVDVRTAIESPNNLLQLDMFAVADANGCLYKLPTLVDMLFEMLAPYGELRLHSAVPSDEDAFYLRHGEASESLKDGKLVEAKVVWVGDTEAKVIIQNNSMEAIIPQAQAGNTSMKLNEIFKPGMVIAARIRNNPESEEVYYDENQRRRYTVTLTTATAALEDFETWERRYCSDIDRAYKPLPNKKQQQQQQQQQQLEQAQRTPSMAARAAKQPLQSRQCDHPLFKQMRIFEVVNELKSAPVGTAFFHPYHKPTVAEQLSCIQLSVKLADLPTGPLIFHVEVKESGTKKRTELKVVPPFRIQVPGKSNKPDAFEAFDDLDEVVARYVERMVERVTEVTTHRKYEQGDMTSVTSKLKALLAAQPPNSQAGIYCVALDSHRPGNGYIAFGSGGAAANVHREYFSITPDGFYFRQRTLDSVEHVITAFKKHPNFKKEQQASRGQPTHDAGYASAGAHVPQVPGAYPAAPGYAAPAAAGYGYARQQQQQYRPPGGYQQGPAPAAAAAGYGQPQQPPGYGYGQQGGYQQQGYQQHGYQQGYNHHH